MEFTNNGAEIMRKQTGQLLFLGLCILMTIASATESSDEKEKADPEKVEYAKGSVCGYCEYCKVPILYMRTNDRDLISENTYKHYIYRKARNEVVFFLFFLQFCQLCEKDCPCETSPTKPNCKMCKVGSSTNIQHGHKVISVELSRWN